MALPRRRVRWRPAPARRAFHFAGAAGYRRGKPWIAAQACSRLPSPPGSASAPHWVPRGLHHQASPKTARSLRMVCPRSCVRVGSARSAGTQEHWPWTPHAARMHLLNAKSHACGAIGGPSPGAGRIAKVSMACHKAAPSGPSRETGTTCCGTAKFAGGRAALNKVGGDAVARGNPYNKGCRQPGRRM